MSLSQNKQPEAGRTRPVLWASVVRIVATFMIFLFHFLAMHDYPTIYLDVTGISLFCFISGFFSYRRDMKPAAWFLARIRVIMIPYWLVIVPVLILNELYGYKDTSLLRNFIILFGGSLFLYNPVYVLSWFISLILIMYALVSLIRVYPNRVYHAALLALVLMLTFIRFDWRIPFYIVIFFLGYGMRALETGEGRKILSGPNVRLNETLFRIQNYTYYFFLVHGGFLVLYIRAMELPPAIVFFLSLASAIPCAVILKKISAGINRAVTAGAGIPGQTS